jgi:DNA-binding response OmpR family regulator
VNTRLLLVEDDRVINQAVSERMRAEGFDVRQVYDGASAVDAAAAWAPDVLVLDVMLPGLDGHEVCRRVQARRPVPVLMLTARDAETDLLVGLGVGADDYLTKPFSMRELVARVRVLLRRVERAAELVRSEPDELSVGDLHIDRAGRRVRVATSDVHLTPTEFDLLACLALQPGTVLGRDELLRDVWGWSDPVAARGGTRTVDSHVRSLRAKIGAERVRTVHGVGYALEDGENT